MQKHGLSLQMLVFRLLHAPLLDGCADSLPHFCGGRPCKSHNQEPVNINRCPILPLIWQVIADVLEEAYDEGEEDFLSFAQNYGGRHQDLKLEDYILRYHPAMPSHSGQDHPAPRIQLWHARSSKAHHLACALWNTRPYQATALKRLPPLPHLLLHSAQITTIDSFCLSVIRDYFHEIDLDPVFRVAEEEELTLLRHEVIADVLEEAYDEGEEDFLSSRIAFTRFFFSSVHSEAALRESAVNFISSKASDIAR